MDDYCCDYCGRLAGRLRRNLCFGEFLRRGSILKQTYKVSMRYVYVGLYVWVCMDWGMEEGMGKTIYI